LTTANFHSHDWSVTYDEHDDLSGSLLIFDFGEEAGVMDDVIFT
jgi:hypothetical protein